MTGNVLTERKNSVCHIVLNRPDRLNAISADLVHELRVVLSDALGDASTDVVLFRGVGRAFCSGDDLTDFALFTAGRWEGVLSGWSTAMWY